MADDLRAIVEAGNAKFMELYNAGDVKGVSHLYTKECRLYPPGTNGATFAGYEQIEGFWAAGTFIRFHSIPSSSIYNSILSRTHVLFFRIF